MKQPRHLGQVLLENMVLVVLIAAVTVPMGMKVQKTAFSAVDQAVESQTSSARLAGESDLFGAEAPPAAPVDRDVPRFPE